MCTKMWNFLNEISSVCKISTKSLSKRIEKVEACVCTQNVTINKLIRDKDILRNKIESLHLLLSEQENCSRKTSLSCENVGENEENVIDVIENISCIESVNIIHKEVDKGNKQDDKMECEHNKQENKKVCFIILNGRTCYFLHNT